MITKTQGTTAVAAVAAAGTTTAIALSNKEDGSLSVDDGNEELAFQTSSNENEGTLNTINSQPTFTVLSLESNFSSKYPNTSSDQTLGGLYGGYFVGTYGSGDSNKGWWDKSYEIWENDKSNGDLSNEFNNGEIESSFASDSSSNTKTLNKTCDKAYKKKKGEIKFENYEYGKEESDNDKKLIRDLMKYCSPMRRTPSTLDDIDKNSYKTSDTLGFKHKKNLVSVTDSSNDMFWKLRNDDFFKDNDNYWSGKLLSLNTKAPQDLKDLYNQKKANPSISSDIKTICAKSYSFSNLNTDHSNQYVYYCSWSFSS